MSYSIYVLVAALKPRAAQRIENLEFASNLTHLYLQVRGSALCLGHVAGHTASGRHALQIAPAARVLVDLTGGGPGVHLQNNHITKIEGLTSCKGLQVRR